MDTITSSYLNNFISKIGLNNEMKESVKFEHFVAFSLLDEKVNTSITKDDLEKISTGESSGIDTIAFFVNNKLVQTSEDLSCFIGQSMNLDLVIIQSKTSTHFDNTELTTFLQIVKDFINDGNEYNIPGLENGKQVYKELLKNIGNIRDKKLFCYFVTLGENQNTANILAETINSYEKQFSTLSFFDEIDISLIGKDTLLKKHKKAITPIKATFKFENKIPLQEIQEVDEAYIGFITFREFKNLIIDKDNSKLKSLFNDNLRDFLGINNKINDGIKKTLQNKRFAEFSLLNNGVTIIADENKGTGNIMVLENYQIVNGCQTSNVLFECKDIDNIDSVVIPLKVVITKDQNLRDSIILSTNSQSNFTEEQMLALTEFQKNLEDFYIANQRIDNLYYERRTNQYANSTVGNSSIVDIREQLKSFMAMFQNLPNLSSGYIGKIVNNHKNAFFQRNHKIIPYYLSGLLSRKWEYYANDTVYKEFNKFRYHIFMGVRFLIEDLPFNPDFLINDKSYSVKDNDKRISSYDKILTCIRNDTSLKQLIDTAIGILKECDYNTAKAAYSQKLTNAYIKKLQDKINGINN